MDAVVFVDHQGVSDTFPGRALRESMQIIHIVETRREGCRASSYFVQSEGYFDTLNISDDSL